MRSAHLYGPSSLDKMWTLHAGSSVVHNFDITRLIRNIVMYKKGGNLARRKWQLFPSPLWYSERAGVGINSRLSEGFSINPWW